LIAAAPLYIRRPAPRTGILVAEMIAQVIKIGVIFAASGYLVVQFRKPSKWLGRLVASSMNRSHSSLTDWGLSHVAIATDATVLDVGCGGGATVKKLAALAPDGRIHGVDYASGSIAASRANNRQLIAEDRVTIEQATVSHLPFPNDQFDIVTAIETQYYWPDLPSDMREILRVLKPGGKLVIIAESYKGAYLDWLEGPLMRVLLRSSRLSPDDQRNLFETAGFIDVQVIAEHRKSWICATGTKPIPPPALR
jgi:ubiquinone/menaquinone biosynthesis C-methylase UbiE